MSIAASLDGVIDLHFEDDGRVKVTPSDKNLMVLSVGEAIEACRAFDDQLRFKDQFDLLLGTLGAWIKSRSDRIAQAYLTVRDAGLLLLIVARSPAYDQCLESDITELEIQAANDPDYHLISLSILAIPSCQADSVQSFLSRKMQLRYVVDGGGKVIILPARIARKTRSAICWPTRRRTLPGSQRPPSIRRCTSSKPYLRMTAKSATAATTASARGC